ncbi:MAG: ABC transporter substrate-binding protein [Defluviitaleaceae bacterium]|nr:ABC transporter substrate-binding protein [Defluviitaleaceae bacterium]
MKKSRNVRILAMSLVAVLTFTACAGPGGAGGGAAPVQHITSDEFPAYTTNDAPVLPRGTGSDNILRFGNATASTFSGLFLATHSDDAADGFVREVITSPFVAWDAANLWTNSGIASFEYDRDANVVIMEMQHDVYWHDGVPLTMDDLVFAYELIAHPDFTGVRFSDETFIPNVVGVDAYRAGTANYISGMVLSNNNRTLRIYYVEPLPPSALFAGSVWVNPVARHHLEPVIAEVGHEGIEGHARARDQLLGFGPFIIDTVVPGESVFLLPNDNYYRGAPLVDGMLIENVPFALVPAAMRSGAHDVVHYQAANLAEYNLMNPSNYQLIGWAAASTTFLNFRIGRRGVDANGDPIAVPRADGHPITNVAIRRALAHASDRQTVSDVVGQGLWTPAPSVLHPFNAGNFINPDAESFTFDLALANQILDEAGFTERDAEGYRLNLDGTPMTFTYGQHSNPTHDVWVPLNIQNWRQIGLRVVMYQGDFLEWNFFTDIVVHGEDYGPIDIFAMGWSLGANPNPTLWAANALFNMPRHTSPAFEQVLGDIMSQEAWDPDFLADAYRRWEQVFYEEVPALPLTWNLDIVAVNNRVANLSRVRTDNGHNIPGNMTANNGFSGWHLMGLTAPAPYVDGQ